MALAQEHHNLELSTEYGRKWWWHEPCKMGGYDEAQESEACQAEVPSLAHVQSWLVNESATPVHPVPDDSSKGKEVKKKLYEFEGQQRTLSEIVAMAKISRRTAYDRLLRGQTTIAELRKPLPRFVNTAWNKYEVRT